MVRIRANDAKEIPLFLLPRIIAEQVLKTGDRIYRISVKRTEHHHYSVSVRTKTLPRELRPGRKVLALSLPPADNRKRACAKGGASS